MKITTNTTDNVALKPSEIAVEGKVEWGKESPVFEFREGDYVLVAEALGSALEGKDFLGTHLFVELPDVDAQLIATLIVYRNDEGEIADIVPVWWEMHTYSPDDGTERLNDFSFKTLVKILV